MIPTVISALAVIHINTDPILFQLGSLSVHWYGVMYVVAFTCGYRFGVLPYLLPRGVSRAECDKVLFWAIIAGLLGARLYFTVQQPNLGDYLHNPINIIAVWQGGMAFFGAMLAGVVALAVLAVRKRMPFWLMWDAAALFAVIGQPFGRIGNIINGDILGSQSNVPWATAYDNSHAVLQAGYHLGVAYQPAGAYEALGTITIGMLLFVLLRRGVRPGTLGITYVGAYAVSQFLIFFLRDSEPVIGLGLKQAQWTALATVVVAVPVLIVLRRRFPLPGADATTAVADSA